MSAAPAAKVPNALKMLVRYWPISGMFVKNTPDNAVKHERGNQHPDMVLRRNGKATREAEQHQQQPRVRDRHEGANDSNGEAYPTNDLEWIHYASPLSLLWTRPCQPEPLARSYVACGISAKVKPWCFMQVVEI